MHRRSLTLGLVVFAMCSGACSILVPVDEHELATDARDDDPDGGTTGDGAPQNDDAGDGARSEDGGGSDALAVEAGDGGTLCNGFAGALVCDDFNGQAIDSRWTKMTVGAARAELVGPPFLSPPSSAVLSVRGSGSSAIEEKATLTQTFAPLDAGTAQLRAKLSVFVSACAASSDVEIAELGFAPPQRVAVRCRPEADGGAVGLSAALKTNAGTTAFSTLQTVSLDTWTTLLIEANRLMDSGTALTASLEDGSGTRFSASAPVRIGQATLRIGPSTSNGTHAAATHFDDVVLTRR